ncbi:cytochrome C oxidase subunit IV family protein [Bdellovibrio svalbardensis]|uniref:Cytochrome C oxidase subunit IV family protein n=1 Tax=Bdellovibrio svalbardensis TaxID=2972972 RepID=A0ABT6DQ43_9BACT|nr:cytochrome C oxidase subunit IV family protein [Bdellovibrio svalbardensis]MDG0817263.1 cytochrome C oxidase subunit IV family protein [Bdellovibrio svalbardensis]
MASNNEHKHDPNVLHPHISPTSMYLKVAAALFALTILTVVAHHFHVQLGAFAGPIAFGIAAVKATLVLLYFMHLKDDNNMNRAIFASGFFFLVVLLLFSVIDIATRVVETSPL